ncbi:hypothetical protein ACI2IP_01550 [Microbacterium sp. NPDC090218]
MPARTDADELRALQRKAYGRTGRLTEEESQRLRELEEARRSTSRPSPRSEAADEADAPVEAAPAEAVPPVEAPPAGAAPAEAAPVEAAPAEAATVDAVPVEAASSAEPDRPAALRGALRQHVVAAIVATTVVLAIGLGAGWALFAARQASIPLTGEQQQRRAELSAATFDPGSVRAVAKTDDALVWYATRDAGAALCMILDVGEQEQTDCLPPDEIERGLTASLPVTSEGSGDDMFFHGETVFATMFLSAGGEPMVGIQQWGGPSAFAAQFPEDVRDRAAELMADGFEFGLSVVSTFRGAPVWLADRLSVQGSTERCLIVDAGGPATCAPFETAVREGLSTQIVDVDPHDGTATVAALDLRFTSQQTAYLAVTEGATAATVTPGESFIVQAPPGDPIEIRAPGEGTGG